MLPRTTKNKRDCVFDQKTIESGQIRVNDLPYPSFRGFSYPRGQNKRRDCKPNRCLFSITPDFMSYDYLSHLTALLIKSLGVLACLFSVAQALNEQETSMILYKLTQSKHR